MCRIDVEMLFKRLFIGLNRNVPTFPPPPFPIPRSQTGKNLKLYKCDLSNTINFKPKVKIDCIVHAAAISPNINISQKNYIDSNIKGTSNIINFALKNNIKNIMVTEISRMSRRYYDTFDFLRDCNNKKISIHIHKEQISTISRDGSENPMLKTFLSMLSDMAESESKTMSHRIKSGKLNSAKKGGGFNQKIYAYDSDENGKPVINEEQAILVKKMFSMILEGTGVRTIANFLNENYDSDNIIF